MVKALIIRAIVAETRCTTKCIALAFDAGTERRVQRIDEIVLQIAWSALRGKAGDAQPVCMT